jgi:hypothetical protein
MAGHPAPAILPCGKRRAAELESENDPAMDLDDEGPPYPKRGGFPSAPPPPPGARGCYVMVPVDGVAGWCPTCSSFQILIMTDRQYAFYKYEEGAAKIRSSQPHQTDHDMLLEHLTKNERNSKDYWKRMERKKLADQDVGKSRSTSSQIRKFLELLNFNDGFAVLPLLVEFNSLKDRHFEVSTLRARARRQNVSAEEIKVRTSQLHSFSARSVASVTGYLDTLSAVVLVADPLRSPVAKVVDLDVIIWTF